MVEKAMATKPENTLVGGDVSAGGLTGKDLEIPRCTLLQKMSPDLDDYKNLKEGQFINSITKEVLTGKFVPLFAFKQYAKFDSQGKPEWSTMDLNEQRVQDGIKWIGGDKPEVTEIINVMCSFISAPDVPLIMSFKSTSFRAGKQFVSLLAIQNGQPYEYTFNIGSKQMQKGSQSWFVPHITVPANAAERKVKPEDIKKYEALINTYRPLVQTVKVQQEGAEQAPF